MSVELNDITSGYSTGLINDNFQIVEDELNNNVLRRDGLSSGEANQMEVDIDMNSNFVYNLPEPVLEHQAARLQDVQNAIAGADSANLISFTPYGPITSGNVQGAIQELVDQGGDLSVTTSTGTQDLSVALDSRAIYVSTISAMLALDTSALTGGQAVYVLENLRGGAFVWNSSGATDDGGIYFASGPGFFERVVKSPVSVCWYGAVPGSDSTSAVQACMDATGKAGFPADDSSYIIDSVTTTRKTDFFAIGGEAKVLLGTPSTAFKEGFRIEHSESSWDWNLKLDGGNTSRTGIVVWNAANNCRIHLDVENITADSGSGNTVAGLSVFNAHDLVFSVNGENILNTGNANESVPRVVSIQDGGDRFVGEKISSKNTGCVFLCSDATGGLSLLDIHDAADNGVYALGNCDIDIGQMVYRGDEEPLVVVGSGSKVHVGNMHVMDSSRYCIGLQDAGIVVVDNLMISEQDTSTPTSALFRTRSGNTTSGTLIINSVSGVMRPERLIATENGTIDKVVINNVNLHIIVDDGTGWIPSFFANLGSTNVYARISNWNIHVTKEPGAAQNIGTLELTMPNFSSEPSLYENINIFLEAGVYRGKVAYQNVIKKNVAIRTDIGPYAREADLIIGDTSYGVHSINGVPTGGYWHAGEDYALLPKTTSPFRARCTASGSPGTWVTYG